ncbi:hypothetical protein BD779DRAFT_1535204 [Infundibulicybe gibba]|nr:hypothetical protein BD779DRAFT_1535204 [Infundibulicybe gibba]
MTSLNLTIGALEVGVLISTFFFGICTVQTCTYYRRYPDDKCLIKAMVGAVWCLELGHAICIFHGLYVMTLSQFAHPGSKHKYHMNPTFAIASLFSGCIATLVQAYFTHRLRILSKTIYLPTFFWLCSILRLAGWIWAGSAGIIACTRLYSGASSAHNWRWPLVPLLAFGACVDFIIAILLCYYFHTSQKSGIQKSTARLVDKLIIWTIQNGLLTSLAGTVTSVCLHTMPDNFVWVSVFMVLTRLFSNSFLASVNTRKDLRKLDTGSATIDQSEVFTSVEFSSSGSAEDNC